MKGFLRLAAALFFAVCLIQTAGAVTIDYDLTNIVGNQWRYDYTIYNDLHTDLYWFVIDFNDADYFGLDVVDESRPFGWDVFARDPEELLGMFLPGQVQAWTFDTGLAYGEFLEFSIIFDWFGLPDKPVGGEQSWLAFAGDFDPENPAASGITAVSDIYPASEVPEPQTFALMASGLLGLAAYYRKNRKR